MADAPAAQPTSTARFESTPWRKGFSAGKLGKSAMHNPYHHATSIQSANFREWERGRIEGAHEEAKHGER